MSAEAITGAPSVIDHLFPEAFGGQTEEDNLWLSGVQCNLYKADLVLVGDPLTGEVAFLFNPRRDTWVRHFRWSHEGDLMVGLTATGRAAIRALRLNRPLLVLARRTWVRAGWHPPAD